MLRPLLIALMSLLPLTLWAGDTNFRAGAGIFIPDVAHAAQGLPDGNQSGFSLMGEFPQSNHTASRFILYRVNEEGIDMTGGETQLMWGTGLAQPGFRLYTGPAWFYEKNRLPRVNGTSTRTFNGWAWQAGTGWQYRDITLDYAASWRDNHDYARENRQAGRATGDVWVHNLLLSYRF